ncbi:MAG: CvpA family protein [Clostridia bacterium]|nr:CvpA family protein [Clostridia bacterium]
MFLDFLLDVIIAAILVGVSFYGYKRGVFRLVVSTIKGLVCFIVSILMCNNVADFIVKPLIGNTIKAYLLEYIEEKTMYTPYDTLFRMPTLLKIAMAVFGIEQESVMVNPTIAELVDIFSNPLITMLSRIVAFFILYILIRYVIKLIVYLADIIFSQGILGKLNSLLGLLLSMLMAFLFAWTFTSLTDFVFHLNFLSDVRIIKEFNGGLLFRFFNSFSLMKLIFSI